MINWALMSAFIPTFFLVSITPGMCMTLSMSLGMAIGVRRTLWMMAGELAGVGIVASSAVVGIAAVMLNFPWIFIAFKVLGGMYLLYLGWQLWRSRGRLAISDSFRNRDIPVRELVWQGFVTAIANPKGWAFFVALLPPFISHDLPLIRQLPVLIGIILSMEWLCLMIYATGGSSLAVLLKRDSNVRLLNRLAGGLMAGVGVWLMAG